MNRRVLNIKEYPDYEFKASSLLQDELFEEGFGDLTNTKVFLTLNKYDHDLVLKNKPPIPLKEVVRVYEVKAKQKIWLKKDLTLLK